MRDRRKFSALLFPILLLALIGYKSISSRSEAQRQYEADRAIQYVAFSADGEDTDPFDYTTIQDYESMFSSYNSRVLYDTLNPAEQQVYRFLEYALDHGYTTIFIDDTLLEETTMEPREILHLLCMDSPFAEQNYNISWGDSSYTFSYLDGKLRFEVTGAKLEINSFSKDKLEKKQQALEEAKRVIQSMPQDLSQLETARWIYRYLTSEVTYRMHQEENQNVHFLHDALIQKQTQCDGFANAFNLLCQLSHIPCFEKIYSTETKDEIGHTWNCFQADGVWYNADCALSEELTEDQIRFGIDFYFGFSDQRQQYAQDKALQLPVCNEDLLPIDCAVASVSTPEMIPELRAAFDRAAQDYVLLRLDQGELTGDDLQNIVDGLRQGLYSLHFFWGGKNHYLLMKQ